MPWAQGQNQELPFAKAAGPPPGQSPGGPRCGPHGPVAGSRFCSRSWRCDETLRCPSVGCAIPASHRPARSSPPAASSTTSIPRAGPRREFPSLAPRLPTSAHWAICRGAWAPTVPPRRSAFPTLPSVRADWLAAAGAPLGCQPFTDPARQITPALIETLNQSRTEFPPADNHPHTRTAETDGGRQKSYGTRSDVKQGCPPLQPAMAASVRRTPGACKTAEEEKSGPNQGSR